MKALRPICQTALNVILVLLCAVSAHAWDSDLKVADAKRIDVVVEIGAEDTKASGLTKESIMARVELELLKNGIYVNSSSNRKDAYLYLNVNTVRDVFYAAVEFHRVVNYTVNSENHRTVATVWHKSGVGTFEKTAFIFDNVSEYLDIFINAYLKVNAP